MNRPKKDVLKGTMDLLILKSLQHAPLHGYGIALHIEKISDELLRVEEGSLYPALHRMEQEGWINAEWKLSETGRKAKYYELTRAGIAHLSEEEAHWQKLTRGVGKVLRYA